MIRILLLHLSYLGIGLVMMRLLFKLDDYPWYLILPVGYFVGVLIHVIILHTAIVATVTSPLVSWALLIIGVHGLVYEIWLAIKTKSIRASCVTGSKWPLISCASIAVILIPVVYLVSLKVVGVPDISYDPTCFWNLKAKYFFYGDHVWTDAFMDTHRIHPHHRYPLYMPIFTFEHFSILGAADDFLTKPGTWIYYWTGMVLFFMLMREWAGTFVALMVIALMLYSPLYSYRSIQGGITTTHVDFPLSLMIMASVGLFLRYLRYENQMDIFGAMMFVSSAILQKQEGLVWFLLFGTFSVVGMWLSHKRKECGWLTLPLVVLCAWLFVQVQLPHEVAPFHWPTVQDLARLDETAPKMFNAWIASILKIRLWGFIPFFAIPAFAIGFLRNLRNIPNLTPAFMVLCYLGAIFLVIMLIDIQHDLFDYYMLRTYDRLIIHILPVSLLLATVMNTRKFIEGD